MVLEKIVVVRIIKNMVDYKKYERMAQKLAGSNLAKLNSGIESMVDDAIKLSNQPWK